MRNKKGMMTASATPPTQPTTPPRAKPPTHPIAQAATQSVPTVFSTVMALLGGVSQSFLQVLARRGWPSPLTTSGSPSTNRARVPVPDGVAIRHREGGRPLGRCLAQLRRRVQ